MSQFSVLTIDTKAVDFRLLSVNTDTFSKIQQLTVGAYKYAKVHMYFTSDIFGFALFYNVSYFYWDYARHAMCVMIYYYYNAQN